MTGPPFSPGCLDARFAQRKLLGRLPGAPKVLACAPRGAAAAKRGESQNDRFSVIMTHESSAPRNLTAPVGKSAAAVPAPALRRS